MTDEKRDDAPPSPVSRRDFLRAGAAAALTAPLTAGSLLAAKGPSPVTGEVPPTVKVFGPGAVPMTLRVNGAERAVNLEPRITLLDALRDTLDLTGSKRACDRGTCGACTVLYDGKAVYACSILAIEAQGHSVETIESLGTAESLHPVQAAFVDNDALQCGFCTPGFVMACKALLDKNPQPSRADVDQALGGNLCRCGAYDGIRRAALDAAKAAGGRAHG